MALSEHLFMSVEDYLILDRNSKSARYEYIDGELRMLAGGSPYHAVITANLNVSIGKSLENSPCLMYSPDVRFQLSESRYVYPDLTVSCDPRDHESEDMLRYPCLVVEVLSPSTENIDRAEKLFYYQKCPSIQEYVMVDSQSIRVEVYHREEDGWKFHIYEPGDIVKLASLSIQFPIEAVYRGTNLTGTRMNKNKRG